MGVWNSGLFSNDTTCDVKDSYIHFLKQQLSNEEAYQKTLEEYKELIGTDEEPLFWYALADTQWNLGRLMPNVKNTALDFIGKKGGVSIWKESHKNVSGWKNTLQRLKEKVESPMPPEKIIKKPIEFVRNPWNTGDVYAYQFHSEKFNKYGLIGKYILFQKIGNVEYYDDFVFSAIQVFDRIFDFVPTLDVIEGIRILPLVNPPGVDGAPYSTEDYIPSFEWYLKSTMIYEKKIHYPKKYMTFIGNKYVPEMEYEGNTLTDFFWQKDGMEEWLIDYYLNWQGIEY